jgi:hypothetical protein
MTLENRSHEEVCSQIQFLQAKYVSAIKIYHQLIRVYDNTISVACQKMVQSSKMIVAIHVEPMFKTHRCWQNFYLSSSPYISYHRNGQLINTDGVHNILRCMM